MKTITIFGGAGARNTLLALKRLGGIKVYSVPSVFDSGGSSGEIRRNFKIYALGDLRDHLIAASEDKKTASIFSARVSTGGENSNLGNLLLLNMAKKYGSKYIDVAHRLLAIPKHIRVIPIVSDVNYTGNLIIYSNRGRSVGEDSLDVNRKIKVRDVKLEKKAVVNEEVRKAVRSSDYVVFGPGDLYSSLIPNLLVDGVLPAINRSKAKKILITNIMNKVSETSGFNTSDFVNEFSRFGLNFDRVISNNNYPNKAVKIKAKYGYLSGFVKNDIKGENVIEADLLNEQVPYEHDPEKLGKVFEDYLLR
ncbi:MAG: 2-phospho-L-lactate transferase CofD family protein [Candidatus Parvarchaeota archaeon]|nr:2-phospho-L-lactate transferase CofD family protein [Candidatus Parvarchaeota archaeon]